MPLPMLKGLAKKAGHSEADAERYWNEAKESAKKEGFQEGTPRFYRYTTGIVKHRMGLGSEKASAEEAGAHPKDPFDHSPRHKDALETVRKHAAGEVRVAPKKYGQHRAFGELHRSKLKELHKELTDKGYTHSERKIDGSSEHSYQKGKTRVYVHKKGYVGQGKAAPAHHLSFQVHTIDGKPEKATTEEAKVKRSKKWSGKATKNDKHDTPDKLFTQPGSKIAKYLHEKFGGAEAEKKINFYINRAGKNLHPADKKRLEAAKNKIQKHLKNAEKAETANSKTYKHHRKTKEEMVQHIENVKKFNELPFNEDQHKHKKEHANVDDREWDHNKDGSAEFLQSNPDTDPTWGISHHASVETASHAEHEEALQHMESHKIKPTRDTGYPSGHIAHHSFTTPARKNKLHQTLVKNGWEHKEHPNEHMFHKNGTKVKIPKHENSPVDVHTPSPTSHASVEKEVDHSWNKEAKVMDEHHHQREAQGHREDTMEAWQKYLKHKSLSEHARDDETRQYHHDLAERFKTIAQIQSQKWKKHVEES